MNAIALPIFIPFLLILTIALTLPSHYVHAWTPLPVKDDPQGITLTGSTGPAHYAGPFLLITERNRHEYLLGY